MKEAKIGHAIMDADIFTSLTHFKGHEMTGFGGAIKNIGMFASFDPLALDQACVDACMAANPLPNSKLSENMNILSYTSYFLLLCLLYLAW